MDDLRISVEIRIFAFFREKIGKKSLHYKFNTKITVLEAIIIFCRDYDICSDILDDKMQLKDYVSILLQGRNISLLNGLDTRLHDNDELAIFPPLAGGCFIQPLTNQVKNKNHQEQRIHEDIEL